MSKIYLHADDFGKSKEISKNIMNCLTNGNLNSVSIIINHTSSQYHSKLKRMKNINKKLHLNLTEMPEKSIKQNSIFKKMSFIKLLLLKKKEKKIIYQEIESQIKKYIKIYKPNLLKIDGHEHIHMIPWILKYLLKIKKKYNIKEFRNSNESLMIPNLVDLLNLKYLRNIIPWLVIRCLHNLNSFPKLTRNEFFGILYSGIQNERTIIKTLNFLNKKKIRYAEILIHPGFASKAEHKNFKKNYFKFYNSKNRIIEKNLCFSNDIKIK